MSKPRSHWYELVWMLIAGPIQFVLLSILFALTIFLLKDVRLSTLTGCGVMIVVAMMMVFITIVTQTVTDKICDKIFKNKE